MNLYFVPSSVQRSLTAEQALAVQQAVEKKASESLEAYRAAQPGASGGKVFTTAMSDMIFRLPARRFAALHQGRTHLYEFGWRSPAFDCELGACHGLELPFVFDTLPCCTGVNGLVGMAPPRDIANRVLRLWVDFATHGRLRWPEYNAESRQLHALEQAETVTDPDNAAAEHLRAQP